MSDTLLAAADEIRTKIGEKVAVLKADPTLAEILRLQQGLNALEELTGGAKTTLAQLFGFDTSGVVETPVAQSSIRPDEFYGLDPLDAAKRYLKKRGQARPFKEIEEAIERGGCKVGDDKELRTRMARSTYEVAVLPDDYYGLVEFYPHLKRGKGSKKRAGLADAPQPSPEPEAEAEAQGADDEQ